MHQPLIQSIHEFQNIVRSRKKSERKPQHLNILQLINCDKVEIQTCVASLDVVLSNWRRNFPESPWLFPPSRACGWSTNKVLHLHSFFEAE